MITLYATIAGMGFVCGMPVWIAYVSRVGDKIDRRYFKDWN